MPWPRLKIWGRSANAVKDNGLIALVERRAARDQRERIEIALHRQISGSTDACAQTGIDRFVDADRIDPGLARHRPRACRRRPWESR